MLEEKFLHLQPLRQAASHVLAAAIFETYPLVDLWISEATDVGFGCECYFPHPIHPDTLPLIEQKMKEIVRQARPIRILEMVPVSASALLKKDGHEEQSAFVLDAVEKGSLVELVEMGAFHQLTKGPLASNASELGAFKLLSIKALPDQGLRIEGVVSYSKDDLKKFIKLLSAFEENNYQKIGFKLGFWKCWDEGVIWLQKGIEVRESLCQTFFQELPLVECSEYSDELLLHFQKNCRLWKGGSTKDLRTSFSSLQQILFYARGEREKNMNSLLHSIHKTFIMLGFDCWIRVVGKRHAWKGVELPDGVRVETAQEPEARIDLMAWDFLMRPVAIASVREVRAPSGKKDALICEAFIEKILVLMLEKNLRTSFF